MTDGAGMRHVLALDRIGRMTLLLVHLTATAVLAGLVWVVQLVVYPSFRLVGASPAWPAFHAAHSRAVALAVGPPWAVQGVAVAALLVRDGPSAAPAADRCAGARHRRRHGRRLGPAAHPARATGTTTPLARRLVTTNWLRTAAWTAGTLCAAVLVARA